MPLLSSAGFILLDLKVPIIQLNKVSFANRKETEWPTTPTSAIFSVFFLIQQILLVIPEFVIPEFII